MEKKKYVKPLLASEEFVPQEYCASCGDSGTNYLFKCDAGGGVYGNVWKDDNGVAGIQKKDKWIIWPIYAEYYADTKLASNFHACPVEHETENKGEFLENCYYESHEDLGNFIPVIVWTGENNDNVHCTTNLNMDTWEIAKS